MDRRIEKLKEPQLLGVEVPTVSRSVRALHLPAVGRCGAFRQFPSWAVPYICLQSADVGHYDCLIITKDLCVHRNPAMTPRDGVVEIETQWTAGSKNWKSPDLLDLRSDMPTSANDGQM
jgi:hypothetical protein